MELANVDHRAARTRVLERREILAGNHACNPFLFICGLLGFVMGSNVSPWILTGGQELSYEVLVTALVLPDCEPLLNVP